METFILNRKSYLYQDALKRKIVLDDKSEFEKETITFIQHWLSGQLHFQFQTSGSTGKPKRVVFTRNQLQLSALRSIDTFKLKSGQTNFACMNTAFVAGIMMLVRAMIGKLNLVIESPVANPLATIDNSISIDFCAISPIQAKTILDETPHKLDQVKTLLIGGAEINTRLEKQLQEVKTNIYHSYAMTETLTHVALRKVNGKVKSDIYHAMRGVSFLTDDRGCLIVNDKVLGIESLITNDKVEFVDKKSFKWIGRYDNVINSGGIKIQVNEIEEEIQRFFADLGIRNVFSILSLPDEKLNNKLILLIEQNEKEIDEKNILILLKKSLPKYHNPKAIKQVQELYLTKSGKIDRKRNTAFYLRN